MRAAMSPSLFALAGLGLLLGLRHAFEPDHLAAVSTLATRQGRLVDACRLGLAWAVGHTASVGVLVAAIMIFGLHLPHRLWPAADLLVAMLDEYDRLTGRTDRPAVDLAPVARMLAECAA